MRAEEAMIGDDVIRIDDNKRGKITYIAAGDKVGCDVDYEDGSYEWIEFDNIKKIGHEYKRYKRYSL